jgi:hypothetical protein
VERPQANKNMVRAADFPVRNAEDVSEQRGWAPKALRRLVYTPKALRLTLSLKRRREPLETSTRKASEPTSSASPGFRDEPFFVIHRGRRRGCSGAARVDTKVSPRDAQVYEATAKPSLR